jgi:hypothetical protein
VPNDDDVLDAEVRDRVCRYGEDIVIVKVELAVDDWSIPISPTCLTADDTTSDVLGDVTMYEDLPRFARRDH